MQFPGVSAHWFISVHQEDKSYIYNFQTDTVYIVSPYKLIELKKIMESRCPKKVDFVLLNKQDISSSLHWKVLIHWTNYLLQ